MYEHFKRQTDEILHEKTWTWLRKGYLCRESDSLLIATQNNAIKLNYVKAKIDITTQQNRKCWLCDHKDRTINHIGECSRLTQTEYETRHD